MSAPRRIGLNLLYLVPGETGGMEIYARELVPALAALRPDLELIAFANSAAGAELAERWSGSVEVVALGEAGGRARRVLAEQTRLGRSLRKHGVQLLHSLGSSAPARAGVPSVVTIHDVIYAQQPSAHSFTMRMGQRVLVPLAARASDRIITDSQAGATEIAQRLHVSPAKIDAIPLAGREPGPAAPAAELRARLGIGDRPIVLSLSAHRPHKNIARLIEAFASIDADPKPALILPGYRTEFELPLERRAHELGIDERVKITGWLPDSDIEGLYAAAACFAFPSLAEGFGLPVLEALARGLPVACSNIAVLREVAGDAALYFDPLDTRSIAVAIERLLTDRQAAAGVAATGPQRAQQFSWERTATETLASYDRAWSAKA